MIDRCYSEGNPAYKNYGGRGIYVCGRWREINGFANFLQDMGKRPPGLSLDRIDNNDGYGPHNCRWATKSEQARNRRSNRRLTIDGVTKVMVEWAETSGISVRVIQDRLRKGWPAPEAVFTPRRQEDKILPGTVLFGWRLEGPASRNKYGVQLYVCTCLTCKTQHILRSYDLRRGKSKCCKSCSMKGNSYARKPRAVLP